MLLLATAANVLYDAAGLLGFVLRKADLRFENNAAATWSGMLLALAAAHAYDGHVRERLHNPDAARAWVLIALVLLALSADEIGSLHERLHLLGYGSWLPLVPFALVLGGSLAYALVLLHRTPANRGKAGYLLLGFAVMASAALHEVVEHRIEFQTAGAKALRAVLEEGSELLGMLIVLQLAMRNTAGFTEGRRASGAAFEAVRELRTVLAGAALVLAPFLAYFTSLLPDQQRGHPADWAAALLLLGAALAACRIYFATGRSIGWHHGLFAALCLLMLLSVTSIGPGKSVELDLLPINLRLLVVGTLGLLAWAVWSWASDVVKRWPQAIAGLLLAAVAGASILPLGLFAVYGLSQVVGLTIYVVSTAGGATRESGQAPGLNEDGKRCGVERV